MSKRSIRSVRHHRLFPTVRSFYSFYEEDEDEDEGEGTDLDVIRAQTPSGVWFWGFISKTMKPRQKEAIQLALAEALASHHAAGTLASQSEILIPIPTDA